MNDLFWKVVTFILDFPYKEYIEIIFVWLVVLGLITGFLGYGSGAPDMPAGIGR